MGKRTLHFDNPGQLSQLYGGNEDNLRSIESKYGAQIVSRDGWLQVAGEDGVVEQVEAVFNLLQDARNQGLKLRKADFDSIVDGIRDGRECALYSMKPVS